MARTRRGFGRIHSPDSRDAQFPMRAMLRPLHLPISRYYTIPRTLPLDQLSSNTCVGHAWTAFMLAAPDMYRQPLSAYDMYRGMVAIDEFEDNDGEATQMDGAKLIYGTSVRAGAKYLQGMKLVTSYIWAHTADEMATWILGGQGTVVMGTNWYDSMSDLGDKDFARITGSPVGGHAYLAIGYNRTTLSFRCLNSWGRNWGSDGRFSIAHPDMDRLLKENGEACTAVETVVLPTVVK